MDVTINLIDIRKNLTESRQLQNFSCREPSMVWSDQQAWQGREKIRVRSGLHLLIEHLHQPEQSYQFEIDESPLEFGVMLSGQTCCDFNDNSGRNRLLKANTGSSFITFSPKAFGIQYSSQTPLITVGLMADPTLLNELNIDNSSNVCKPFLELIHGYSQTPFFRFEPLTKSIRDVALQVYNCTLEGSLRSIFLESKALELLVYFIERLEADSLLPDSSLSLTTGETNKIKEAREIIICEFQNPPSLFDLAKMVGLTHTRLNRGFREIFGKTVFEFLREYRLNDAKKLLLDSSLSISEIAFSTGFNDSSYFSKCFLQAYGIQPRNYRKTILGT
ncbi:AraC family transcriptional regulator [bacterium]|nr:AraC family transcriptional regulator [bacterium]